MDIAAPNQWPEQKRPTLLLMIHLPLALHDAQQGLNRLVIRRRIFARSLHNVVDGPLPNTPQDLKQAMFAWRRKYWRLALAGLPHH